MMVEAEDDGNIQQAHIDVAREQTSRSEDDLQQACDRATRLAEEVGILMRAYGEEVLRAETAEAGARASGAEARILQAECAEQEARACATQDRFS